MRKKSRPTLAQVKEYVTYWKKRLRLNDWTVGHIRIETDPEKFPNFAAIRHSLTFQEMDIIVLEPSVIPEEWAGKRDLEVSVVHELLHTRWIFCDIPKSCKHHEEMAIETTATLLVALKRGINPEDIN